MEGVPPFQAIAYASALAGADAATKGAAAASQDEASSRVLCSF